MDKDDDKKVDTKAAATTKTEDKTDTPSRGKVSLAASGTRMFDVGAVLSGAMNEGLAQVTLIGRKTNGDYYVASSLSAEEALMAFQVAPGEIHRLAEQTNEA